MPAVLKTFTARRSRRPQIQRVSNAPLFYAIAGVSMSSAGFAGLYLTLRPQGAA